MRLCTEDLLKAFEGVTYVMEIVHVSIFPVAIKVIGSNENTITFNDYYTSLIHCGTKVLADLIKLPHEVPDLLFAQDVFLAVADTVLQSEVDGGLSDAALRDARSVVICLGHEPCRVPSSTKAC